MHWLALARPRAVLASLGARLVLASTARARRRRPGQRCPPHWATQTTTAPQALPQAPPPAFDVVEGAAPRLRLRARDLGAAEVVELGVVARADRRLLVAVHAGRTYVGIAPDATPALEDEATGAEIAPDVPGLALADALLCLADGRGLRPHAAWVTGVVAIAFGDGGELRLRVVVRNPFPAMAALCARAGGFCLVQTLRCTRSRRALAEGDRLRPRRAYPIKIAAFRRVSRRAWLARARPRTYDYCVRVDGGHGAGHGDHGADHGGHGAGTAGRRGDT